MNKDADQTNNAHKFYRETMQLLAESQYDFLVGGGYSLKKYTGIYRDTKDLDLFCKAGEFQRIIKYLADQGYETELTDVRWLAKVFKGDHVIDLIFNSVNNLCPVTDSWFESANDGELFGIPVKYVAAEELVWCKIYVHNRERYDGADINHVVLRYGHKMEWKRVLEHMDQHWHLLLAQLLNFQFVYPSDRDIIPRWLFDELLERAKAQFDVPVSTARVCLGPIIDQTQYSIDIKKWDYKSITMKSV